MESDATSIAPPEHIAGSAIDTMLPPPPTMTSSRLRAVREPEITPMAVVKARVDDDDESGIEDEVSAGK